MKYLFFILLLLPLGSINAQISNDFDREMQFGRYLLNTKQPAEALYLFKNVEKLQLNTQQRDTLNFVFGKLYFAEKDLEGASIYLSKITNSSRSYFTESQMFNSFNHIYLNEYKDADSLLNQIKPTTPAINELIKLEKSGLALLKRDLIAFDKLQNEFDPNFYQLSKQQESLASISTDLKAHKYKSPTVAGFMSTIIPGSGKIYAGKTGQGIMGLLTTGILGLQALEGYRKDGPRSFRFIAFSTIFSFFYVGNIWGSVFTVKTSNDEFNEAVDHKILLDLHIPLRSIFN